LRFVREVLRTPAAVRCSSGRLDADDDLPARTLLRLTDLRERESLGNGDDERPLGDGADQRSEALWTRVRRVVTNFEPALVSALLSSTSCDPVRVNRVTPGPTATTSPAASRPRMAGSSRGKPGRFIPWRNFQSIGLMLVATTRFRPCGSPISTA
jgi:hypothetical protein